MRLVTSHTTLSIVAPTRCPSVACALTVRRQYASSIIIGKLRKASVLASLISADVARHDKVRRKRTPALSKSPRTMSQRTMSHRCSWVRLPAQRHVGGSNDAAEDHCCAASCRKLVRSRSPVQHAATPEAAQRYWLSCAAHACSPLPSSSSLTPSAGKREGFSVGVVRSVVLRSIEVKVRARMHAASRVTCIGTAPLRPSSYAPALGTNLCSGRSDGRRDQQRIRRRRDDLAPMPCSIRCAALTRRGF